MIYTIQLLTESGAFAAPEGTDVLVVPGKETIHRRLARWAKAHEQAGADPSKAYAWVFKGRVPDVQDAYPDYVARLGPKGGLKIEPA